jgi:hypothetical protein
MSEPSRRDDSPRGTNPPRSSEWPGPIELRLPRVRLRTRAPPAWPNRHGFEAEPVATDARGRGSDRSRSSRRAERTHRLTTPARNEPNGALGSLGKAFRCLPVAGTLRVPSAETQERGWCRGRHAERACDSEAARSPARNEPNGGLEKLGRLYGPDAGIRNEPNGAMGAPGKSCRRTPAAPNEPNDRPAASADRTNPRDSGHSGPSLPAEVAGAERTEDPVRLCSGRDRR